MPRARHDAILDVPVADWPAAMQAHVVQREELVTEPEYRDMTAADRHHLAPARNEIAALSDRLEFRQRYFRAAGVSVVSFFSAPRI